MALLRAAIPFAMLVLLVSVPILLLLGQTGQALVTLGALCCALPYAAHRQRVLEARLQD